MDLQALFAKLPGINILFKYNSQKGKKKTSLLIVFKVLVIVLVAFYGLYYGYILYNRPTNVRITNVGAHSFTVTWITKSPSKGLVAYSENKLIKYLPYPFNTLVSKFAYDVRDVNKAELQYAKKLRSKDAFSNKYKVTVLKQDKHYVHYVTVKNIKERTNYYFKIGNGFAFWGEKLAINEKNPLFAKNSNYNKKQAFNVLTYREIDALQKPNPSFGSVLFADYVPYKDSYIVSYVTVNPTKPAFGIVSYPESSILNKEGNWYIDLSNVRRIGTGEPLKIKNEDKYYQFLEIYGREGLVYSTVISLTQNAPADPIKLAIYSNNKLKDSVKAKLQQKLNSLYASLGISDLSDHVIPKVNAILIGDPGNSNSGGSSSNSGSSNSGANNSPTPTAAPQCNTHALVGAIDKTISRKNSQGCKETCVQTLYKYVNECNGTRKTETGSPHNCKVVQDSCPNNQATPTPTKKPTTTPTPTPKAAMTRAECKEVCSADPSEYGATTVGACVSKCMGSTNSGSSSSGGNTSANQSNASHDECKLECSDPSVNNYNQCYHRCKTLQESTSTNTLQEPSNTDTCPTDDRYDFVDVARGCPNLYEDKGTCKKDGKNVRICKPKYLKDVVDYCEDLQKNGEVISLNGTCMEGYTPTYKCLVRTESIDQIYGTVCKKDLACKKGGYYKVVPTNKECGKDYVELYTCMDGPYDYKQCKVANRKKLKLCSEVKTSDFIKIADKACPFRSKKIGTCVEELVDANGDVLSDSEVQTKLVCEDIFKGLPRCRDGKDSSGYIYKHVPEREKCNRNEGFEQISFCADLIKERQCKSIKPAGQLDTCAKDGLGTDGYTRKIVANASLCGDGYKLEKTCYRNGSTEPMAQCISTTVFLGQVYPDCVNSDTPINNHKWKYVENGVCAAGYSPAGKCKIHGDLNPKLQCKSDKVYSGQGFDECFKGTSLMNANSTTYKRPKNESCVAPEEFTGYCQDSAAIKIYRLCTVAISMDTPASPGMIVITSTPNTTSFNTIKFTWQVQAASDNYLRYTHDGQLIALEGGKYVFKYKGKTYTVEMVKGTKNRIFLDENKNGIKDKNEKYLDEVTKVTQLKIAVSAVKYEYRLEPGYNFVHFPFAFDKPNLAKASNFLKFLRTQGNVSMISYFDGRWHTLDRFALASVEQAGYAQEGDFTIVPGRGYVIRNMGVDPITFTVDGKPIDQVLPVNLIRGWNLVGFYNPNKTYTASSLVKSMNSTGDLNVVNITKWQSGRYDGVQQQNDKTYGFDFPVLWDVGYFVNVKDIKTTDKIYTWQDK